MYRVRASCTAPEGRALRFRATPTPLESIVNNASSHFLLQPLFYRRIGCLYF